MNAHDRKSRAQRIARDILRRDRIFSFLLIHGWAGRMMAHWWVGMQALILDARLFSFGSAACMIVWGLLAVLSGFWPAGSDLPVIETIEETIFGPFALHLQGVLAIWAGVLGMYTTAFARQWRFFVGLGVMVVFWLLPITTMWSAAGLFSLRLPGAMIAACAWAAYRAQRDREEAKAVHYEAQRREHDELLRRANRGKPRTVTPER